MGSIFNKTYQRLSNISLVFVLTLSSLTVFGQAFFATPVSALTTPVCVDFTPNGNTPQTISPVTISTSGYWQSWNVSVASGYKLSSTSSYYANVRSGYTPSESQKSTTHPAYYVNANYTTQTSTVIANPGASQSAGSSPFSYSYYLATLRVCYLTTDSVAPNVYTKGDGNSYTPTSVGSHVYDTYSVVNFKLNDNVSLANWSVNGGTLRPISGTWSDANNIGVGSNGGVYGSNSITVSDATGNSRTVNFILDNVGPTVTPKVSSVGSIASNLYSEVDFKLYDGYLVSKWQVNSGTLHNQTPDQWSDANDIAVGVNDGVLGLNTIKVWDVAGNMSTYDFVLNNVGPTITVKSPLSGYTPYSIGDPIANIFSKINFKLYDANKVTQFQINSAPIVNVTDNSWSDANNITVGGFGGVYGVNTIRVWDLAGNVSEFEFYLDNVGPDITVTGGDFAIEAGDTYIEQGATWTDDFDGSGDVTDIVGTVDNLVPGDYVITYTQTDTAGNTSVDYRTVTVIDTTAPIVVLNGGDITLTEGETYVELGATWTDIVDGNGDADVLGSVDTSTPGVYELTYSYTDSLGNSSSVTRTVTVNEQPAQVLAATNDNGDENTASEAATNDAEVQGESNAEGVSSTSDQKSDDSNKTDGNIFGLAWYWWLLILIALGALWWWIIGALKKRAEDK